MSISPENQSLQDLFDSALKHYENGQFAEAKSTFQQLCELSPTMSEAWLNLGNACFKLDELIDSEKHWQKAIELNPLEANAYLNLGNLFFKRDMFKRATYYWEQFKSIKPRSKSVWLNLGLAYERLGWMDKALENYQGFMSLDPQSKETRELDKRFRSAKAIVDSNIKLAQKALSQGLITKAREVYEKTIPLYPVSAITHKTFAAVLYQQKEYKDALEQYLLAHQKDPEDPGILINIAIIYEYQKKGIEALWAYHAALELPNCPDASRVKKRLDDLYQACQNQFGIYLDEASQDLRNGKFDEAETKFKRLYALKELSPSTENAVLDNLAQLKTRKSPIQRAARTYYHLGEKSRQEGRYDQAMGFFKKYLQLMPEGEKAAEVQQRLEEIQKQIGAVISTMLSSGRQDG